MAIRLRAVDVTEATASFILEVMSSSAKDWSKQKMARQSSLNAKKALKKSDL